MTQEQSPPGYESDPELRFAELRPRMLRTAVFAAGGDTHLAEDAVQEAMLRVFKKYSNLADFSPQQLEALGKKTVRNVIADEYRKMYKRKLKMIPSSPEDLPDGASDVGLPEAAYEEIRADVYKFINKLSFRLKQVVFYRIICDIHPVEVADLMEVSEATVTRYLNTALRRLEKEMSAPSEEVSA